MADDSTSTGKRPIQVTVAAWVVGAASLGLLLTAASLLARLHTVDLRQGVERFLTEGTGRSLGLGLEQALTLTRIGLMVLGAVCAAMLVFAFFASRRDRSARVAMTVLAVPLLVCGLFVDVFLVGFVVGAVVLLWSAPARDWYAGRAPRTAPATAAPATDHPPAYTGGSGRVEPTRRSTRPRAVLTACLLTWAFSALVTVFLVTALFSLRSARVRGQFQQALDQNPQAREIGLKVGDLTTISAIALVLIVVWTLAAAGIAVLVYRRSGWARIALVLSAVAAGLLALLSSIASPGFLLVTVACGATVALLLRREVTAWFRRADPPRTTGR